MFRFLSIINNIFTVFANHTCMSLRFFTWSEVFPHVWCFSTLTTHLQKVFSNNSLKYWSINFVGKPIEGPQILGVKIFLKQNNNKNHLSMLPAHPTNTVPNFSFLHQQYLSSCAFLLAFLLSASSQLLSSQLLLYVSFPFLSLLFPYEEHPLFLFLLSRMLSLLSLLLFLLIQLCLFLICLLFSLPFLSFFLLFLYPFQCVSIHTKG